MIIVVRAQRKLCRTYGAPSYLGIVSQRFRAGLAYAAPPALVGWPGRMLRAAGGARVRQPRDPPLRAVAWLLSWQAGAQQAAPLPIQRQRQARRASACKGGGKPHSQITSTGGVSRRNARPRCGYEPIARYICHANENVGDVGGFDAFCGFTYNRGIHFA